MIDYPNTLKSLEASLKKFQKEHATIYRLLAEEGIKCRTIGAGMRRFVRRHHKLLKQMSEAKKLLK